LGRRREPEEYERAMKDVLLESERTTRLLDSLLTLARADSGVASLDLEPMDLASALREAVGEGRRFAEEKSIVVHDEIPEHPVKIHGDPDAIRRVFLILIDNAVKYTGPGGVVRVWLRSNGGSGEAAVGDNGIGIAREDQEHIFDRFWRADKVRSREAGGAGLGLSIARWIVDQHHGSIRVESQPGHGSVFRISIPELETGTAQTGTAES
jgi:signal transduction histidine kinase